MSERQLRIALIQYDVSHDPGANLSTIARMLSGVECDIALLPELCTSGYLFADRAGLRRAAERLDGRSVEALAELSARRGCALVFGMAELDGAQVYDTAVVVDGGRLCGAYRKQHLSRYESGLFAPGEGGGVIEARGVALGVQICFDLWFPEVARAQVRAGAELLCALANFGGPTSREIARVRAIENLTPLALCNRTGHERLPWLDAEFRGESAVWDRDGVARAEAGAGAAAAACEVRLGLARSNALCDDFERELARHYAR